MLSQVLNHTRGVAGLAEHFKWLESRLVPARRHATADLQPKVRDELSGVLLKDAKGGERWWKSVFIPIPPPLGKRWLVLGVLGRTSGECEHFPFRLTHGLPLQPAEILRSRSVSVALVVGVSLGMTVDVGSPSLVP